MGVVSEILKTTRVSYSQQIDAAAPSCRQIPPAKVRIGIAGGCVLRTSISVVVIGFAFLGSVGNAVAQYLPPQPPPPGYPPPAPYPYSVSPPRYQGGYPDGDPYQDSYDRLYAPRPPRVLYQPPASYPHPANSSSYPGGVPGVAPSSQGTEIAALPPEYQPERAAQEPPPQFHRTVVAYPTIEPPGTIIIDTPNTYLYLTIGHGQAIRYGIGVGREGFTWSGTERISRMKEWPDWLPPPEMIKRQPYLPRFMAGGETNPLGARAMYLGNTEYRIHGTNQPSTIGTFVSSGCIRLTNADVEDLYSRVRVGTRVIVLPGANTAASQLRRR
jgi:lipoprotein-anchoring transpeptidase ErfK/SrfK